MRLPDRLALVAQFAVLGREDQRGTDAGQNCKTDDPGTSEASGTVCRLVHRSLRWRALTRQRLLGEVLEQCRELADRSHEPALRALYFTCARRMVLAAIPMESSDGQIPA